MPSTTGVHFYPNCITRIYVNRLCGVFRRSKGIIPLRAKSPHSAFFGGLVRFRHIIQFSATFIVYIVLQIFVRVKSRHALFYEKNIRRFRPPIPLFFRQDNHQHQNSNNSYLPPSSSQISTSYQLDKSFTSDAPPPPAATQTPYNGGKSHKRKFASQMYNDYYKIIYVVLVIIYMIFILFFFLLLTIHKKRKVL